MFDHWAVFITMHTAPIGEKRAFEVTDARVTMVRVPRDIRRFYQYGRIQFMRVGVGDQLGDQ